MLHGLFKYLDLHLAEAIAVLERNIQTLRLARRAACNIIKLRRFKLRD